MARATTINHTPPNPFWKRRSFWGWLVPILVGAYFAYPSFVAASYRLPIVFCYRKDLSPNQRRDADILRDKFHADLVIWGKLKNASFECNTDGFCLQSDPSDSLKTYAGGKISKPKLDDYQFGISSSDIETELIRMGTEIFDDWLVEMFNSKLGGINQNCL